MDQNELTPAFEDSVKQVTQHLPAPIRHYLGQGAYSTIVQSLTNKYSLSSDQASALERAVILLLMGIENPDEFSQTLVVDGHLDGQVVRGISHDVNEQIFIPLRAQMQKEESTTSKPAAPQTVRPATSTVPQQRIMMPAPNYAPPKPPTPPAVPAPMASAPVPPALPRLAPQPAREQWASQWAPSSTVIQANPSLPQRPAQVADAMMHYTPFPKPSMPRAVPLRPADAFQANRAERVTAIPPVQKPIIESDRMLEDHEEPSPKMRPSSGVIQPGARAPIARTTPPPPNLPGAMPPPAPRPIQQFQVPKLATAAQYPPRPVAPVAPPPIARPPGVDRYSMDPYREPLEDSTKE